MGLDTPKEKPHDRLATLLSEDMGRVNALIRERMASKHAPRIPEVTAHLVEAGGKRLRPLLTLASARMCGYDGPFHVHLAATVEFIHTATLLHDDVVDESSQRRGRPTANLLWDNKSSVLVGDYLFARSFQLMVEPGNLRVLDILSTVIRDRQAMTKKIKAVSSEGRLSALILTVLPAIIFMAIHTSTPSFYGDVMDDPLFKPFAAAILGLVIFQGLLLRRLVTFKF